VPSLDLRFADNKSLVDSVSGQSLVTFSRASSASYTDSTGTLRTAATNEPRFDHNPITGESLGLLVEEPRTNSIANNTGVGVVAGTPGTLPTNWTWNTAGGGSTEVVGTGTENGISYVDVRLFGTLTSGRAIQFVANATIAAATGQTWTTSVYCKIISLVSGTPDLRLRIVEMSGAGSYLTEGNTTLSISSASLVASRSTFTRTLTNALTGYVVPTILIQGSGAIDITLRIGLPQLEQGAFATSVIPTTTAAATRAADVASITGTNFSSWYNQTEGSFFCSTFAPKGTTIFGTGDTFDNTQYVTAGASNNVSIRSGGSDQAFLSAAVSSSTNTSIAFGYAFNSFAAVSNGGTISTDTSGAVPLAQIRLKLGSSAWSPSTGNEINGTIRRLTFFPARLPNTTLQRLTQP
jgi:hypothetical protein